MQNQPPVRPPVCTDEASSPIESNSLGPFAPQVNNSTSLYLDNVGLTMAAGAHWNQVTACSLSPEKMSRPCIT